MEDTKQITISGHLHRLAKSMSAARGTKLREWMESAVQAKLDAAEPPRIDPRIN